MKISFHCLSLLTVCAGAVVLPGIGQCAPTKQNARVTSTAVSTNNVDEMPKSVFDEKLGKDPFFPRRSTVAPVINTTAAIRFSDFNLNGITQSGKPTAMVNGRTFEKGEEGEVKLSNGTKARIRCIEIKADSILINLENSTDPVELKMRPGNF